MRYGLARGLVLAAAVATASSSTSTQTSAPLSVPDAVTLYARGDFDTAVRDLDTRQLTVAAVTRALDTWIAAGDPVAEPRRRIVAAAFALDAVWAATRNWPNDRQENYDSSAHVTPPLDPERLRFVQFAAQGFVAHWALQRLPPAGVTDSIERTLCLAAIGIAEDGHAWQRLQDEIVPLARKRLRDDPRLRLADVLARTNLALGSLRLSSLGRNDVLSLEHLRSDVTGRIPESIRTFEPLLADANLAAEVELRIGYLELRRGRWSDALARFGTARSKTAEPMLGAAADYFSGRVHEQLGHRDDAIAAYQRALTFAPMMRNLATRLAALLFLRNERAEAYAILDPALNVRPAPVDLLVAIERADARFVPDWLSSIRRALQ